MRYDVILKSGRILWIESTKIDVELTRAAPENMLFVIGNEGAFIRKSEIAAIMEHREEVSQ